jgi:hypothetical protein
MSTTQITIRPARPVDAWALTRLAGLDDAKPLTGEVLLAEADGKPVAAVEVATQRTVADPFEHSGAAAAVLRMRAGQLAAPRAERRPLLRRALLRVASG